MTEQSWATQEAYNWLANTESAYNEIMAAQEDERRDVIQGIVEAWVDMPEMYHQDAKWLAEIDLDSLAADFADPDEEDCDGPRYEHKCNGCRYLGQHGKYDLYAHVDSIEKLVLLKAGVQCGSIMLKLHEVEAANAAMELAEKEDVFK